MNKFKMCLSLFATFFKIGAFTIGGGYAMLPLIQREVAEKRKWIEESTMFDIVAIAESTPGPIAINTATFVGTRAAGFWGAFAATFGTVLPSFLIISCLSFVLEKALQYEPVEFAFNGIRAGVIALIVKALWGMAKQCPKNLFSAVLVVAAFALDLFTGVNVLFIIFGGALIGLATALISKNSVDKEAKK
ncbi:MAG: chromate transporter [Ruminococcaceae bacterium]|nr:chromate transporter [Oscillospiraceae bacterium]